MQERREYVRIKTPVLIEFPNPATWKTERSFTHDISEGGLRFPTEVKLQMGQELALTLALPFKETNFHASGEVLWIREISRHAGTQYEVGIRFKWIEDQDQQRLQRFLLAFLPSGCDIMTAARRCGPPTSSLPCRLTVGHVTLDHGILVRVQAGQPIHAGLHYENKSECVR